MAFFSLAKCLDKCIFFIMPSKYRKRLMSQGDSLPDPQAPGPRLLRVGLLWEVRPRRPGSREAQRDGQLACCCQAGGAPAEHRPLENQAPPPGNPGVDRLSPPGHPARPSALPSESSGVPWRDLPRAQQRGAGSPQGAH